MADKVRFRDVMMDELDRIAFAFRHPFKLTPFQTGGDKDPEQRLGVVDLGHAIVNFPVEFCRAMPHTAGHIWFWHVVGSLAFLILAIVVHL